MENSEDLTIITFNNHLKDEIKSELNYDNSIKNEQLKKEIKNEILDEFKQYKEEIKNEILDDYNDNKWSEIKQMVQHIGIFYLIYTCIKK